MPERVGIPGFRRGRRYVAISGAPEYFNLYEADSPETLAGQDYLNRLNAPTPWTQRVVPSFRNVARSICRVAFTNGVGSGGVMLTLRFAIDAAHRDEHGRRAAPATAAAARLSQGRRRRAPVPRRRGGEQRRDGGEAACAPTPPRCPSWIVLIEGNAVPDVEGAADDLAPALAGARRDGARRARSTGSSSRGSRPRGARADRAPRPENTMALVPLIEYADASPEVRAVYDDIMATRNVASVNNFWKALAQRPGEPRARLGQREGGDGGGRARSADQGAGVRRGVGDQQLRVLHPLAHGRRPRARA